MNKLISVFVTLFIGISSFLNASVTSGLVTLTNPNGVFPGNFVSWNITNNPVSNPFAYHYQYILSYSLSSQPAGGPTPLVFALQVDPSNTNASFGNFSSVGGIVQTVYPIFPINLTPNGMYALAWSQFLPPVVSLTSYGYPGLVGVVFSFDSTSAPVFGSVDTGYFFGSGIQWAWNSGLDGSGTAFIGVPGAAPVVAVPEPATWLLLGSSLVLVMFAKRRIAI